jgi:hypothetical protein
MSSFHFLWIRLASIPDLLSLKICTAIPAIGLENYYSLRLILLFANIDVSRHILVIDTSVLESEGVLDFIISFVEVFSINGVN